ncbi:MAG: hypothetical protein IKQ07_05695, partial [Bacteroidaceae bacterium]|nr:hypothetical protein [Bacteroidaceae bacterium]
FNILDIYNLTIYDLLFIYDLFNVQFSNLQCTIDLQFSNLVIYFSPHVSPPLEGLGEAVISTRPLSPSLLGKGLGSEAVSRAKVRQFVEITK